MTSSRRHKAYLDFVSRVSTLTSRYSIDDLEEFMYISNDGYSHLIPIINALVMFAERAESNASPIARRSKSSNSNDMHLFDLLRSKKLFPKNSDLADFANRILPGIESHRFGKLSRADIAARIIEFVESMDPHRRAKLEHSMRDALRDSSMPNRKNFFNKWESIIKGI